MPDQYYPPLRIWVISGTVFIVLFLVVHVLALRYNHALVQKKQKQEATYLLKHVVEHFKKNESKTKVMVLGSSIVGQGIACEEEFDDTTFRNIVMGKVYVPAYYKIVESWIDAKVFDSILKYPPAVVLIEIDQLAYKIKEDTSFFDRAQESIFFIKNLKITTGYSWANYKMPAYCGRSINETIPDSMLAPTISWEARTFEDLCVIHPELKRLREAGIRIILIQIPRPAEIEVLLHDEKKDKQLQALLTAYKLHYQIDYWSYPNKLPYAYFYDQGHLNKKGRTTYSKWLYTKLQKEIR
ncbi:MAG: hypothetical protein H7282_17535 [Cytophagaceae bacterium]|nr:hypothetical protein [Cytophagaceae bacterium]